MELLTPWHLLLVLAGFMLLFGYKKLPDASRSLGRSLRIFKGEMTALREEPAREDVAPQAGEATPVTPPALT